MPSAAELSGARQPLSASLEAGVETISSNQEITFIRYIRLVLPLDGFVYWVRSDLVSPTAPPFDSSAYNEAVATATAGGTATLNVRGSLHYATTAKQEADANMSVNSVIFTALEGIQDLNDIAPNVLYIGEWQGIRFAFSQRRSYYQQAGLHHYVGDAVLPIMESQIIDDLSGFDASNQVVSNSLPAWLSWGNGLEVFPSYLVPDNLYPSYVSVDIYPDATDFLQPTPRLTSDLTHYQLMTDRVILHIYGLNNDQALDFVDYLLAQMEPDSSPLGLMNGPVVRDMKRGQNELGVLAMGKTIEFKVSYYQTRMRDLTRQLILTCIPTYSFA